MISLKMPTPLKPFEVLLVVGIDAIGLARFPYLLHKAGCRVTVLAPAGLAVLRSRYVACHLPTANEAQARALHLKAVLGSQHPPFAQVVVGDEPTLTALAEHRGQDWLDDWFPVDHRSGKIEVMLSKWAFQQAAIKAGLYTPQAKVCRNWPELESAVQDMGYALMLKSFTGLSGSGVRKVCDSGELESAFAQLTQLDPLLLAQRFHDGLLGSTDVLFDHGVPVCWQSSYSLHCWPTPLAASSRRTIMHHPDTEALLAKVGQMTGFHGFAGIDWIQDKISDRLYLLELNPRPTPSYHLDSHSGVSFSHSLKQLLAGQRTITPPQPRPVAPMIDLFPQSLYWAISERDWRSFMGCWRDAPWHDPGLLCAYLRRTLTHFLPERWRQKMRQWRRGST